MTIEAKAMQAQLISAGRGATILVIEDESGVREMIRRLLEFRGFRTLVAENGPAGLALYREHRAEVSAVVTDMRMPDMSGVEVIHALRAINSQVRIVAMSGVVDINSLFVEEPGRLAYLPKPMTSTELMHAVQSVLDRAAGTSEMGR